MEKKMKYCNPGEEGDTSECQLRVMDGSIQTMAMYYLVTNWIIYMAKDNCNEKLNQMLESQLKY